MDDKMQRYYIYGGCAADLGPPVGKKYMVVAVGSDQGALCSTLEEAKELVAKVNDLPAETRREVIIRHQTKD